MEKIGYSRTMLGEARLDNIEFCIKDVIAKNIPGDLIECGPWRGGGSIYMRGVLESMNELQRCVWVADSFEGLPRPSKEEDMEWDLSKDVFPHLAVSLKQVQTAFSDYDLLDDRVRFLQGWFKDTLPGAPIEQLAVLRLDGDLYESTMDSLEALYTRVSPGGYVIVDDFHIPACAAAVQDFRNKTKVSDPINEIDWTGVFWQKSSTQ